MTEEEAIQLCHEVQKSYLYAEVFMPTRWVIAAVIEAARRAQSQNVPYAGMPASLEERRKAAYALGDWLSAALDDPNVCQEYKDVINAWFDAGMPYRQLLVEENAELKEQIRRLQLEADNYLRRIYG
jgi:hypothetical protein